MKFSHERKVRSFAKKTLGSTRVGSAIRLPADHNQYAELSGFQLMSVNVPGAV